MMLLLMPSIDSNHQGPGVQMVSHIIFHRQRAVRLRDVDWDSRTFTRRREDAAG